jgi:hypothetical protein
MWEGAPDSEMISSSTRDASTAIVEEVVAWGAFASSVEAGTCLSDDVEGHSGSFSSPSFFIYKDALLHFHVTCTLKDIMRTRSSLIKGHITWLNNDVSLKVKHSIRSAMQDVSKHDAIKRPRLKFIKISTFQSKELASKRPEMRGRRLSTKVKLKGGKSSAGGFDLRYSKQC